MVRDKYIFKLFIAGNDPKAQPAVDTLRRICEEDLRCEFELQVLDIVEDREQAEEHRIVATPTLLKLAPLPRLCIIGDLSNQAEVLNALRPAEA